MLGLPGAGVGDHRLQPQPVGELDVDDGVGAVVGDAVDGRRRRALRPGRSPSASGRTARVAGPSATGTGEGEAGVAEGAARDRALDQVHGADEAGDEGGGRLAVERRRAARSARSGRRA